MARKMQDYLISDTALELVSDSKRYASEMAKGRTIQDIVGWSDDVLLDMYDAAVSLASRQEYADAEDAFLFLTTVNPAVPSFWIGVGLCRKGLGRFDEALHAFRMSVVYGCDNWATYEHTVQCCLETDRADAAVAVLDVALYIAEMEPDAPNSEDLAERATKLKAYIQKKVES